MSNASCKHGKGVETMDDFLRPRYESDADYTTNAPSYYDELARKQKLFKLLAKRIWEYDKRLDVKFEELDNLLDTRFEEWQTKIDKLPTELRELFTEWLNDGTLADLVNIDVMNLKADKLNPYFENEFSEKAAFGEELAINNTDLGEGWTGNNVDGFQHISENVKPLTFTFNENITGIYKITVDILKDDYTDTQGVSDYYISLGGSEHFETYRGSVTKQVWGINALGLNNNLVISPNKNFTGKLKFSVKKMISTVSPNNTFYDSNNNLTYESRLTTPNIQSTYLGLRSGESSFGLENESNVGVGFQSLQNNTSGFWNVALGKNALTSTTVGSRNVGIGYIALQDNVSGDRNIAIGPFSLRRNTTGRNNIAIGADSLWFNDTREHNIGIGLVALGGNTDGNNNIALGNHVMQGAKGGEHNFAVGNLAMYYNEGRHNVSIGFMSKYQNRGGDHSIAIGSRSNYNGVDGRLNIALGFETLFENISGENNIAIGTSALNKNLGGLNIGLGVGSLSNSTNANSNIAIGEYALNYAASDKNIGIGSYALYLHETGKDNIGLGENTLRNSKNKERNVAIGKAALNDITGNRNVSIGVNAGFDYQTGENNVFIGDASGSRTDESGSNNILIGSGALTSVRGASNEINIGNAIKSKDSVLIEIAKLMLTALPTTKPTGTGTVWNDNGTLKIV